MSENKINLDEVEAPTLLDGSPVDKEEAAKMHAGLVSGKMKIVLCEGVAEELAAMGLSEEDMRSMMTASVKKTMS